MKTILDIAYKDLFELVRNRMTFLFLLVMPMVFTVIFGFAFGGFGGIQEDPRLPVGFIDADGGQIGRELTAMLEDSPVLRLVEAPGGTAGDIEQQVAEGDLAALVIIPAGYSQAALAGTPIGLTLILDGNSAAGLAVQGDILGSASRLMDAVRTARIVLETTGAGGTFDTLLAETLAAWEQPPIRVADTTIAGAEDGSTSASSFSHTSPGMMLQFAIAGLLTAAQVLVTERKSRCLQRLLTTRASRFQILAGHYLSIVALLLAQFIILIVFGQFFLKLDYLREPLATLLVALASALCIGALGLLIGVLAKSEEQAIMFSLIPMFILSGLGGAWVPLEVTGATFQTIGHISPVAWAMDGFQNITARGLGLASTLIPVIALLGYALLFCLLAGWRFRVSEERG